MSEMTNHSNVRLQAGKTFVCLHVQNFSFLCQSAKISNISTRKNSHLKVCSVAAVPRTGTRYSAEDAHEILKRYSLAL